MWNRYSTYRCKPIAYSQEYLNSLEQCLTDISDGVTDVIANLENVRGMTSVDMKHMPFIYNYIYILC